MVRRNLILIILFLSCSAMALIYLSGNRFNNSSSEQNDTLLKPKPISKPIPKYFFEWPIKGIIDLAGNFGELRTNHFHSGVDIRTEEGKIGIPVYASGDGYIGRINISA